MKSVDSIMTMLGDIVLESLRKLLSAVLHWLVFVLKFVVPTTLPTPIPLAWLKSYCYSGENQLEDVGGRAWSWTM